MKIDRSIRGKFFLATVDTEGHPVNLDTGNHHWSVTKRVAIPAGSIGIGIGQPTEGYGQLADSFYVHIQESKLITHRNNFIEFKFNKTFAGKKVCFTGKLKYSRAFFRALVVLSGGAVCSKVSKELNLLVMERKTFSSTKTAKAEKIGINQITQDDLLEMLAPNDPAVFPTFQNVLPYYKHLISDSTNEDKESGIIAISYHEYPCCIWCNSMTKECAGARACCNNPKHKFKPWKRLAL